jgi:hypothetical protein
MYIILAENDYLQAEPLEETLRETFNPSKFFRYKTEKEFQDALSEIAANPPNVFVIDVMLPWTQPNPEEEEFIGDEEQASSSYHQAGMRCALLLAENEQTKNIPVILYTVLKGSDVANLKKEQPLPNQPYSSIHYVRKEADFQNLIDKIREFTGT